MSGDTRERGLTERAADLLRERLMSLDGPGLGHDACDALLAHATRRPATPDELLLAREAAVERVLSGARVLDAPVSVAITSVRLVPRTRRTRRGERSAKMLTRRGKGEYKRHGMRPLA